MSCVHLYSGKCTALYTCHLYLNTEARAPIEIAEWTLIRRRDATRLIYEILTLARGGVSKYRIMSGVSLSFPQTERYLSFLLNNGHLDLTSNGNGVQNYLLTPKGERLRYLLGEVQEELDTLFTRAVPSSKFSTGSILQLLATETVNPHRD